MAGKGKSKKNDAKAPGLIGRFVRGVFRLVFGFLWRITAVVALVVLGAAGFFYAQLPPYEQLFDGRGVGSATLTDVNGNIFA